MRRGSDWFRFIRRAFVIVMKALLGLWVLICVIWIGYAVYEIGKDTGRREIADSIVNACNDNGRFDYGDDHYRCAKIKKTTLKQLLEDWRANEQATTN